MLEFCNRFNDKKHSKIKIIGIVRNKDKARIRFGDYLKINNLKIIIQDICLPLKIKDKINFIIHAASHASPIYYDIDPVGTLKANVIGTYHLLELSRKNPVESFFIFQ